MLLIYSFDLFALIGNIDAKSDAIFVIQSKSVQSDIYLFETINTVQVANTAHVCKWIIGVLQKLGENVLSPFPDRCERLKLYIALEWIGDVSHNNDKENHVNSIMSINYQLNLKNDI